MFDQFNQNSVQQNFYVNKILKKNDLKFICRDSLDLVCTLSNNIINLIFPIENLKTVTDSLKLKNKYDKSIDQCSLHQSEYSVRASNQYTFILSGREVNKNKQSIIASINASDNNVNSIFTQTILKELPNSSQSIHRFISQTNSKLLFQYFQQNNVLIFIVLDTLSQTTKLTPKSSKMNRASQSTVTVLSKN